MDKPKTDTEGKADLQKIENDIAALDISPAPQTQQTPPAPTPTTETDEIDFLDECLQGTNERLNLTADEKDDLEDLDDEEVQKEYAEFMRNIADNTKANDFLSQLNKMMESGMGGDFGEGQDFANILGDMGGDGNFDMFTDNLIGQFIDKEVIYEPLKEARLKVHEHIALAPANKSAKNEKVLSILDQIISLMDVDAQNTPEGKERIMQLFEELQDNGGLPEEIVKDSTGDNPELAKLQGLTQNNGCCIF